MKKNLTFLILLALLASSCASRRQNVPPVFPREQATGYTNLMLHRKYADVDTASFQQLERTERIFHLFAGAICDVRSARIRKTQQRRLQYPDVRINDIDHVFQWLRELYSDNRGFGLDPLFIDFSHYKEVEDGFLIKGVQTSHYRRALHYPCLRKRSELWLIFLMGFDHNMVSVREWQEHCPLAYEINIDWYKRLDRP